MVDPSSLSNSSAKADGTRHSTADTYNSLETGECPEGEAFGVRTKNGKIDAVKHRVASIPSPSGLDV
jgi:hypothetical protein